MSWMEGAVVVEFVVGVEVSGQEELKPVVVWPSLAWMHLKGA